MVKIVIFIVIVLHGSVVVDTLYTIRFREVSGLSSFENFLNQTTGCGDIAYSPVGYFILSHPVYQTLFTC